MLKTICLVAALIAVPSFGANKLSDAEMQSRIGREVRHELVTQPLYGIFDNLAYKVDKDGTVTLSGQTTRPTLKSDAENSVKGIEGVKKVVNSIEVLPLLPADDGIRIAVYRAVYGQASLNRYALQAIPSIHIIVKNGDVTLEGVVANTQDRQIAETQAKTVSGIFKVTNNLRTDSK
ncbi:MAG: BON domain-containing protein [Acidobacteriota bacterium]